MILMPVFIYKYIQYDQNFEKSIHNSASVSCVSM